MWWIYNVVILGALGATVATMVANLFVMGSLRRGRKAPISPLVSVLVPARNEVKRIARCLGSLQLQDYGNLEVIVLDDDSSDGTADAAREIGFEEGPGRFQLLRGEPLPPGWVGKCWACHQLARAARGDVLFFTDADTEHCPETVSAALAHAVQTRADLLSAWPRQEMKTWSEKLVIPLLYLLGAAIYPHWAAALLQRFPAWAARLPRRVRDSMGVANGQFMFFQRAAYERIGGHESVKDHLVEDVALGRNVMSRMGMRLVNCDALEVSSCRMYESFPELWEGFTKNLRAVFGGSLLAFLLSGAIQCACLFLPFVLLFFPVPGWELIAVQVGVIYFIRVVLTLRFRTSWIGCLLHPVAMMLSFLIALNSWRRLTGQGVTWKGRRYGGK